MYHVTTTCIRVPDMAYIVSSQTNLKVVVTAGASMQIYIFFNLYSISLSIRDKFSHL